MRNFILVLILLVIVVVGAIGYFSDSTYYPDQAVVLKEKFSQKATKKVDHSKFAILQKKFHKPQDVTAACLTCHTETHKEVMQSSHWNWQRADYIQGKGIVYLGKRNILNNFCIGTQTNVKSCAKCHIGYDMTEDHSSYKNPLNIDCLVCHDNSVTYVKGANLAGNPAPSVDLNKVAQSVGRPTRDNCGVCHFFGGGGNAIKHGDLDNSMFHPDRKVDIHMDEAGPNLVCVDCHKTENHQISGKVYSIASINTGRATCEECHTETPHTSDILNEHTVKVACQTCHIPIYSKTRSTNMYWDWSTAGELRDGKPFMEEDSLGNHTYKSIKGTFTYARNIVPDYIWFNGTADHYVLGDKVEDTTKVFCLNPLHGSYADEISKIIPVKIHYTKIPFDPVNKMLIQPHLYADKKGEGAYWKDYDWNEANKVGMERVGLPYSGKYTFIKTSMYWPLNHQVSPKEESLTCNNCHTDQNSRLAGLTDFYMPARDSNSWIELSGKLMILLSILAVFLHGGIRIYLSRKQK